MPNVITSLDELEASPEGRRPFLVAVESMREAEEVAQSSISVSALIERIGRGMVEHVKVAPWKMVLTSNVIHLGYKLARDIISGPPLERVENTSIAIVTKQVASELALQAEGRLVFARHPGAVLRYFPVATFHDDLFQDKLAELERLVAHLGARTVSLEYEYETGEAAKASLSGGDGVTTVNVSGESHRQEARSALLNSTFRKPNGPPTIPSELAWLKTEPLWRQMAELRISHGRIAYELELKVSKDYGVNAEVAAGMKLAKLNIGGEYKGLETKRLKVKIEFWPLDE